MSVDGLKYQISDCTMTYQGDMSNPNDKGSVSQFAGNI